MHAEYQTMEGGHPSDAHSGARPRRLQGESCDTGTGTISNLTKAQVAFIWRVVSSCTPADVVHDVAARIYHSLQPSAMEGV